MQVDDKIFEYLINIDANLPFYGVDNYCFKLLNFVFEACEDPGDGYRSYLSTIRLADDNNCIFFDSPVATVSIRPRTHESVEGYELVDENGHIWLTVGTDNMDDYYPYFVFNYTPPEPRT